MSRLSFAFVASAPLVFALSSCSSGPVACTDEARSSLAVTVVDQDGAALTDASVTATVDDETNTCEHTGEGSYDCGFYERAGDFVVAAEKAGYEPDDESVAVGEDECHVVTETVSLTLTVVEDAGCCCAYIKPGDFDIVSEDPADTRAECLARDQGECIDPSQRLTPHACCPDVTTERCGG